MLMTVNTWPELQARIVNNLWGVFSMVPPGQLRGSTTVAEQQTFFTAGVLQSQATRAIWPTRNHLGQQFQELDIQGILTAEGHGGWSYRDGETACLGISTADFVAIGRARKRLVLVEDEGIVFRVGHSGCLVGRFVSDALPLPDDVLDRVGGCRFLLSSAGCQG